MRMPLRNMIFAFAVIVLPGICLAQVLPDQNYLCGKARLETGDYDSALVYLDEAIRVAPSNADAHFCKGLALYHKKQYSMAIREFEQVEKSSKGKASIWIARCYAELRDTRNCINALEVHLTSNYRLPESTILLDKDLSQLENDPLYISFWKNGDWYTGFDETMAEAEYLIRSKNYPDAINLLSEGLKKGYRKAPLYQKRAEAYMSSGNLKPALEDINSSLEIDRKNPELLVLRAKVLYADEKYKDALVDINEAVRLEPDELIYRVTRGMVLSRNGMYGDAVSDLNLYLSYYPSNDSVWYRFGMIHFENNNYFEAINCFNRSLKLNQRDARYFAARGETYLKTRTYQYAWKDLSMALDLNPNDVVSWVNKGLAALSTGNKEDACFCFDMAKKLGSKDGYNYAEKYCK
jgi:tetratricopeptide (TPR) repeat protein